MVCAMLWAYFISNVGKTVKIENGGLFLLIRECNLGEDSVYTDDWGAGHTELESLLGVVQEGDTVMVRSIADLGDSTNSIFESLSLLESKGVEVASVVEPWYDGRRGLEMVESVFCIVRELGERKRKRGIEKATAEGRMGRKVDPQKAHRMKRMRDAGFSVKEICEICGVGKSTFYRQTQNLSKK